jgi:hypothetical protein
MNRYYRNYRNYRNDWRFSSVTAALTPLQRTIS